MKILKGASGQVRGYITEIGNGKEMLKTANGTLKGYYDANSNQTTKPNGHLVGYGNLLADLLD